METNGYMLPIGGIAEGAPFTPFHNGFNALSQDLWAKAMHTTSISWLAGIAATGTARWLLHY